MAIAAGLAPGLGRPAATTIVLAFFDQWVSAVGRADADRQQSQFFAIGLVRSDDDQRPPEITVTNGTFEQITTAVLLNSAVLVSRFFDMDRYPPGEVVGGGRGRCGGFYCSRDADRVVGFSSWVLLQ
jgi:hypothetical protein